MDCTKLNCPMQAGTTTDRCGDNCPWRTTVKTGDLISRAALLKDLSYCAPELWQDEEYIKSKIMKQPAVDAVPLEHGQWQEVHIKARGYGKVWYQHNCSPMLYESPYYYCPFCGTPMDKKGK